MDKLLTISYGYGLNQSLRQHTYIFDIDQPDYLLYIKGVFSIPIIEQIFVLDKVKCDFSRAEFF